MMFCKNLFSEGGTRDSYGTSILGNIKSGEFQLPRGISNIFQKSGTSNLRNTLQRKKDKEVYIYISYDMLTHV